MYVILTDRPHNNSMLLRSALTMQLSHTVAAAFTSDRQDAFSKTLRSVFGDQQFAAYCIDNLQGSVTVITFSKKQKPCIYSFNGEAVRIREPDASDFQLRLSENQAVKLPALLTSDKKAYIS